jgi:hypothetical protein
MAEARRVVRARRELEQAYHAVDDAKARLARDEGLYQTNLCAYTEESALLEVAKEACRNADASSQAMSSAYLKSVIGRVETLHETMTVFRDRRRARKIELSRLVLEERMAQDKLEHVEDLLRRTQIQNNQKAMDVARLEAETVAEAEQEMAAALLGPRHGLKPLPVRSSWLKTFAGTGRRR